MSLDVQAQQTNLDLPAGGTGRLKFTVTNVSDEPLSVVARAVPAESTPAELVDAGHIAVERPSRNLPAGGMDDFIVEVDVPEPTAAGTYGFTLRVASSESDAVQVWGDSPQVVVTVPDAEKPPPSWPKWLLLAAGVLAGIIAGVVVVNLFDDDDQEWRRIASGNPRILRQGESTSIGTIDGADQLLSLTQGRLRVRRPPLVALESPAEGDEAARCADALAAASRPEEEVADTVPPVTIGPPQPIGVDIPVDGRDLCAIVGDDDEIGVIEVFQVAASTLTFSVDTFAFE